MSVAAAKPIESLQELELIEEIVFEPQNHFFFRCSCQPPVALREGLDG